MEPLVLEGKIILPGGNIDDVWVNGRNLNEELRAHFAKGQSDWITVDLPGSYRVTVERLEQ